MDSAEITLSHRYFLRAYPQLLKLDMHVNFLNLKFSRLIWQNLQYKVFMAWSVNYEVFMALTVIMEDIYLAQYTVHFST